jgi:hypothetical protein
MYVFVVRLVIYWFALAQEMRWKITFELGFFSEAVAGLHNFIMHNTELIT